ncbi:hypothetical protein QFC20_007817 [Naganishia adeliensis]|uniref:Uncharacterized protein n=1 Tax=Naganishia adeliensis TaxID=92952 RepID=A0ACC2UUM3_9TREE|nr:hypothetical protein QFC20_007817 [Naganishia adeliensis]
MSSDSSLAPRPVFVARTPTSSPTSSSRNATKPRSLDSLVAGGLAGAVEGLVTFPTDLCKTRLQLVHQQEARKAQGLLAMMKAIYLKDGFKGFYSGAPPVVVGNAVKSCVRFASYERFKALLRGNDGKLSRFNNLLAGLMAGTAESIVAVTPSEAIKTRMIQDTTSPKPRFRSTTHALRIIVKEEGVLGLYRGLGSVILKQGTNSAVRFSTYTFSTEQYDHLRKIEPSQRSSWVTFGLGALSGIVTVYASQPFE